VTAAADQRFMRRALRLAVPGLRTCAPNPAVGCVIVAGGRVVGEGAHRRTGEPHAEAFALRAAGPAARGATAYVTLEPCNHHGNTPPCAPALIEAGIARVVVAAGDPDERVAGSGLNRLRDAGIRVDMGVCHAEARRVNRGFFTRMERGRPWLTLKLAASLDGKIALADGSSRWITGSVARAAVHRERARAGAVLTGVGTVLADDPALSARVPGAERQPLRAVLDTRLRTTPSGRLFGPGGAVHLFCTEPDAGRRSALETAGAAVHVVAADAAGRPDPAGVLAELARLYVNEVYAECGPTLAGALLASGLVDETELFLGPHLLGPSARPLAILEDLTAIPEPPRLRVVASQRAGRDARIRLQKEAMCSPES